MKLNNLIKGRQGGAAMATVSSNEITFISSGTFDPEDPRPITPDTQFETASIAKVFTALLLAKSERLGRVSRNDPVGKYLLPANDPDAAKLVHITLLLLATHHSGLPREPLKIPVTIDSDRYPFAEYTCDQLINALRSDGPGAAPDLAFAYSNFGFSLLGQAIAVAWCNSYAQVLREQVLRPLGLARTIVAMKGTPATKDLAPGHANGKRIDHWTFDAAAPACALRSSVRELARFLSTCLAQPDGPMCVDLIETMKPLRKTDIGFIGMGWGIAGESPHRTYSHSGGIGGYRSFLGFTPQNHRGVVILTNTVANVDELGCSLLGLKVPLPIPQVVNNATDYVGRYPLSPSFAIRIAEQNGVLYFQATAQPGVWLRAQSFDRFILTGAPAEVYFQRDDSGKVESLIWHQNGRKYKALRCELPSPPKEITIPQVALAEYAGQYLLKTDFVITVRLADAGLVAQATGQSEAPIFASAKDEFFYKVVEARISFIRKPNGEIAGLILTQSGRAILAERIPYDGSN